MKTMGWADPPASLKKRSQISGPICPPPMTINHPSCGPWVAAGSEVMKAASAIEANARFMPYSWSNCSSNSASFSLL